VADRNRTRGGDSDSSGMSWGRGLGARGESCSSWSTGGGSSHVYRGGVPHQSKFPKHGKAAAASPEPRNLPWECSLR
jgi:hypothetical protein